MSGDVQPRKRKDKKRKKDDLGFEEPRGTAAVFGEGDVFMHSQHDHGTGGHWCAKIIFFSLLAVLVTLIGLIILENRGLTELEANAVESRYSGVLDGWIEDAPDDDHHDEHTLELKHHDEDEHGNVSNDPDEQSEEDDDEVAQEEDNNDSDLDDDDEENEQDLDADDLSQEDNDDDSDDDDKEESNENNDENEDDQNLEENEDEDNTVYRKYYTNQKSSHIDKLDDDEDEHGDNDDEQYDNDDEQGDNDDKQDENNDEQYENEDEQDDNDDELGDNNDEQGDKDDDEKANNDDEQDDNEDDSNEDKNELRYTNDNNNQDQSNEFDDEDNDELNDNEHVKHSNEEVSNENDNIEEDEDEQEHDVIDDDPNIEVETIEREVSEEGEEEPLPESAEEQEQVESKEDNLSEEQDVSKEVELEHLDDEIDEEDEEFLEPDDEEPVVVEHITAPAGKPLVEVDEEETSTEKPPDTLAEEEEYERQQEELRRQKEEASHKDGGNSLEDDWPGEPSDPYWRRQLDKAEQDFRKGEWSAAMEEAGATELRASARARWIVARALDSLAEAKRDNALLSRAIAAYLELLKMNERLSNKMLLEVTSRTLDRIKFRGNYISAEPVYRLLIRRFPEDVHHHNNLTVSLLMANRADLAEEVLKETIKLWPNDRIALAHLGFVLKTQHNQLEEAVAAFEKALEGDSGPANEPRFYYHLGDALLLLGRFKEAHEVHKRGTALGHFLSPAQRSLYNVDRLKSKPWWDIEKTPYVKLARALESSWREILKEGEAASALYEKEKEGLKERGEWSQLDLFVRGREVPGRCQTAPVTCGIVKAEPAASGCRRGQIKFSRMQAGTHVRPHVGPTNCRLRLHLGLSNTTNTHIRVDQETRQWHTGKVFMFDDSFEHEVWHNGTGTRLVLIVDVWHPDLTQLERRQLPAI